MYIVHLFHSLREPIETLLCSGIWRSVYLYSATTSSGNFVIDNTETFDTIAFILFHDFFIGLSPCSLSDSEFKKTFSGKYKHEYILSMNEDIDAHRIHLLFIFVWISVTDIFANVVCRFVKFARNNRK